jgi:1-aminocyclopropane-1-carboxylate deaminase
LLQAKKRIREHYSLSGAYSNHIAAVAFAEKGFKTIGIVRGDELHDKIATNPTLQFAQKHGMQFEFVSKKNTD